MSTLPTNMSKYLHGSGSLAIFAYCYFTRHINTSFDDGFKIAVSAIIHKNKLRLNIFSKKRFKKKNFSI